MSIVNDAAQASEEKFASIIKSRTLLGKSEGFFSSILSPLRKTRDSIVGAAYQRYYPKSYNKQLAGVLDKNKDLGPNLLGAIEKGTPGQVNSATADIAKAFKAGSKFGPSPNTSFVNNINKSIAGGTMNALFFGRELSESQSFARSRMAQLGLKSGPVDPRNMIKRGNSAFKMGATMLGLSPGKAAAGIGLATAGIVGAGALFDVSPSQAASGIGTAFNAVNEVFKEGARPKYGSSELGQSTQGLVFGLHSRRTR